MRLWRGWRGWLSAFWLCLAFALLASACAPFSDLTVVATAPVSSGLTVFSVQGAGAKLVALRARDGSTRWTYNVDTGINDLYSGPVVFSNGLLIGFTFDHSQSDHMTLLAVDGATGHSRWRVRVDGLPVPLMTVAKDYIVLYLALQLHAGPLRVIRTSDGKVMRDIPISMVGFSAAEGNTLYYCDYDATLTAFQLDDGHALWTTAIAGGTTVPGMGCTIRAGGGIVFCHAIFSSANGQQVVRLVAVRERDGLQLWQKPVGLDYLNEQAGYYFPRSISSSGQATTNSLVAYRTTDGETLWQIPAESYSNNNTVGDGNVVVFTQGGDLRAVRATDGSSLWQYAHPEDHYLVATDVVGGLVFAGSYGAWPKNDLPSWGTDKRSSLLVLGADNGRLYWKTPLDLISVAIGEA